MGFSRVQSPHLAPGRSVAGSESSDTTLAANDFDETRLLMEPFRAEQEQDQSARDQEAYSSTPLPLPKGAMRPMSSETVPILQYTPGSPAQSPSHSPNPSKVQFATYPPDEKTKPWNDIPPQIAHSVDHGWTPTPLRTWFWVTFSCVLVALAITLEVMLAVTNKRNGWPTKSTQTSQSGVYHFVYTLPPVAVAMILVAMWAWTDIEIKKMQPYVDLAHGDAPAHTSVLLDYTRTNNFIVWARAAANRHYIVALASLMALLALSLQPLAAALLTVRSTWLATPDMVLNNTAAIGLNLNNQFWDLTAFLTAAGYASASVLYNLGDPKFVHDGYTISPFQLPTNLVANGTVYANTTAIQSNPGCQPAQNLSMNFNQSNATWTNSATFPGCSYTWEVQHTTENLFGISTCPSTDGTPDYLVPVIFWYFTYLPTPAASITFCKPSISLWNVNVNVDIASGNLTQVTTLSPLSPGTGNFTSFAGNVTGAPLNGAAYNGIDFNLSNPDAFTIQRQNATQLTLPAAVFEAAILSPEGLAGAFNNNMFVGLTNQVYTTYLSLLAKTVYFLPVNEPMTVQVKTVENRVWLSSVAVHLLTTAMLILAFFSTIVNVLHRDDRKYLKLAHQPGTIASAVVVGAQTNMGTLLSHSKNTEDIMLALRDKRFRINVDTMKIVMEGEEGYEQATSPDHRKSMFGLADLLSPRPMSKRFSRPPPMPATPPA